MSRLLVSQHGAETQSLDLVEGREYSIGRNSDCDVRLETHSGISRVHVRVRHDGQNWLAESVSKFGKVLSDGAAVSVVELADGVSFRVNPYDFVYEEAAPEVAMAASDGFSRGARSIVPAQSAFGGNDEATSVGTALRLAAFLRILPGQGRPEQEVWLEGGPWLAGRDEDASIFINDPKASRKQFEILQTSKGWLIKDLGSSNGTTLNGAVLPANEALPLKSGDVISVQSVRILFEARDVSFAQKAAALVAVSAVVPVHSAHSPDDSRLGSRLGGAVLRRDEAPWKRQVRVRWNSASPLAKGALAVIALIAVYLLFGDGGAVKEGGMKPPALDAEFGKLTTAERQRVENVYRLTQEFYIRKDYNMALGQLETIHKMLPKGYERSLELKESIEIAQHAIEEQDGIRRQREELQRQDAEAKQIVEKCRPLAATTSSSDEIRFCLDRALQLRPDNADAQAMLAAVDLRRAESDARHAQSAAFAQSAARGRELYAKAERALKAGQRREALVAFQAHLRAKRADPDGLRAKSEAEIGRLRKALASEVQSSVEAAERAIEKGDYRSALESSKRALEIDPENPRAHESGAKAKGQLNSVLEALYADSVVYENFGQLDAAKEKWRKILESDQKGGDFWVKARNKLNAYGGP